MEPNQPNPAPTPPQNVPPPSPQLAPMQYQPPVTVQTNSVPTSGGFNKMLIIIPLLLVLLAIMGFGAYYFYNQTQVGNQHYAKVESLSTDTNLAAQGHPIQVDSLNFNAPWSGYQSATESGTTKRFLFSNNRIVTVIETPPNSLITKTDLSLPNDQFQNKFKTAALGDVDLQEYILNNTKADSNPVLDMNSEKNRMQTLRQAFFALPGVDYSVVKNGKMTVIKGYSSTMAQLETHDNQSNVYTILIKADALSEEDLNGIIRSIHYT